MQLACDEAVPPGPPPPRAVGNHEMDYPGMQWLPSWSGFGTDSGGECGVPYQKHFMMPLSGPNASLNLW